MTTMMKGEKIDVNGFSLHYEKVGTGPVVVLLMPGGLGSSRTDFEDQLDGGLDPKKFTLIAWDPPGYGHSRPPERNWTNDVYKNDAELAASLMKKLGYDSYCIIGWSDGGKTAIYLSSKHQGAVEKLVTFGVGTYDIPRCTRAFNSTRNIANWNLELRAKFERVYGDQLQEMWAKLIDFYAQHGKDVNGVYIPDEVLQKIQCPCLICHGDIDPMISLEHAEHLVEVLADSRLERFPKGSHNLHQTHSVEFNRIVSKFLLE